MTDAQAHMWACLPKKARCVIILMRMCSHWNRKWGWLNVEQRMRICGLCCLDVTETCKHVPLEGLTNENIKHELLQEFLQYCTSFQELPTRMELANYIPACWVYLVDYKIRILFLNTQLYGLRWSKIATCHINNDIWSILLCLSVFFIVVSLP